MAVGAGGFQSSEGGSEGGSEEGDNDGAGSLVGGEGGTELEAAAAAEAASMMAGIECEGGCDFSTSGTGLPGDPVVISARGGGAKRDKKRVAGKREAGKKVAQRGQGQRQGQGRNSGANSRSGGGGGGGGGSGGKSVRGLTLSLDSRIRYQGMDRATKEVAMRDE